jgi:hypothetical protein
MYVVLQVTGMDRGTAVGRRGFLAAAAGATAVTGYADRGRARIDPELAGSSGRVQAVVRLEDAATTRRRHEHPVGRLKAHAATTQQGIVDHVRGVGGIEIRRRFWLANAVLVTVDTDRASFAELAAIDGVDRVHRNTTSGERPDRDSTEAAGEASLTAQADGEASYGLEMMNVPEVWDRFDTRGEGATVAVIDTGVDPSHPDIELAAWADFDAKGERVDSDPYDPDGHGTGMSSLATGGDASGTRIGVAPDADLLVAKHSLDGFFASALAALEWAVENDADVASMSFDFGPLRHDAVEPIANAAAAGTVVTASAVVDPDAFLSPGSLYNVLSTGALDSELTPYRGGNGGEIRTDRYWRGKPIPEEWPERYAAPAVTTAGVDVLGAVPDNDEYDGGHTRTSGYSNGPPHVSGVVALLRSLDAEVPPGEIRRILAETADHPGGRYEQPATSGDFGHGIVDAAAAAAELVGRDREVAGTVTDPEGDPVAGATVTAVTGDTAETDGQGRYSVSVPPGDATVTASAVGYEPVTRAVAPGEGRDLAFDSERRPDVRLASRPPTRVAPGGTATVELAVEHAEFATVFVEESSVPVDSGAVSGRLNGEPIEVGEPANIEGETRLRLELDVADGTRGLLRVSVSLADEERNANLRLDAIHVHERPMRVATDERLRTAIDTAVPGTTLTLAGGRRELAVEPFESPLPDSRFDVPIFAETRDDEAGLLIDKPVTLAAAEGADPTLVATGGSAERRFGIQIASHFVTLRGIEVVAEGAMAAVNVLTADGVRLADLDLSGGERGVYTQFTKSLDLRRSRVSAAATGVSLEAFSINSLVRDNTIRDAERGVFLSGRLGDQLFDVDADVSGNSFEDVARRIETEGTTTIRGAGGEERRVGGEPPGDSMLDLLLYAATAGAVGVLFYPYGRRRLG